MFVQSLFIKLYQFRVILNDTFFFINETINLFDRYKNAMYKLNVYACVRCMFSLKLHRIDKVQKRKGKRTRSE